MVPIGDATDGMWGEAEEAKILGLARLPAIPEMGHRQVGNLEGHQRLLHSLVQ